MMRYDVVSGCQNKYTLYSFLQAYLEAAIREDVHDQDLTLPAHFLTWAGQEEWG